MQNNHGRSQEPDRDPLETILSEHAKDCIARLLFEFVFPEPDPTDIGASRERKAIKTGVEAMLELISGFAAVGRVQSVETSVEYGDSGGDDASVVENVLHFNIGCTYPETRGCSEKLANPLREMARLFSGAALFGTVIGGPDSNPGNPEARTVVDRTGE